MKQIKKYLAPMANSFSLSLPKDSIILSAQVQYINNITIWAMADPYEEKFETRNFEMYATEDLIDDSKNRSYISSISSAIGNDFHLFEVIPILEDN